MTDKCRPYFGGIPMEPQVRKLLDTFGSPEPGIIRHDQIETVIGENRRSSRYQSIVVAWRKRMFKEQNIDSDAVRGVGVKILTESERVDVSGKDFGRASKRVVRSHHRISVVQNEKLDEKTKYKADHLRRITAMSAGALAASVREYRKLATRNNDPKQLLPHRTSR